MYLALTGARAKAADLYALGIASHVTSSDKIEAIIERLAGAEISDSDDVNMILKEFHSDPEPAPMVPVMDMIDDHFDAINLADIFTSLENDEGEWAQKQLSILKSKSPMSLLITFEQLKRGAAMERFRDNMQMEFRVVCRAMADNDFHEGVRAILIDKDQAPKWSPASLTDISAADVMGHFEAFATASEELNLG
jgi:enoyl-CoA hydratase/carnithine racemase